MPEKKRKNQVLSWKLEDVSARKVRKQFVKFRVLLKRETFSVLLEVRAWLPSHTAAGNTSNSYSRLFMGLNIAVNNVTQLFFRKRYYLSSNFYL